MLFSPYSFFKKGFLSSCAITLAYRYQILHCILECILFGAQVIWLKTQNSGKKSYPLFFKTVNNRPHKGKLCFLKGCWQAVFLALFWTFLSTGKKPSLMNIVKTDEQIKERKEVEVLQTNQEWFDKLYSMKWCFQIWGHKYWMRESAMPVGWRTPSWAIAALFAFMMNKLLNQISRSSSSLGESQSVPEY